MMMLQLVNVIVGLSSKGLRKGCTYSNDYALSHETCKPYIAM